MPFSLFIPLLFLVFTPSTMANINNEKVDLAYFAFQEAYKEDIDPAKFLGLMACESKLSRRASGDFRLETNQYMAHGIFQFWESTYNRFSKAYGVEGNYENSYSQIKLAAVMIKNGLWYHWKNCGLSVGYP